MLWRVLLMATWIQQQDSVYALPITGGRGKHVACSMPIGMRKNTLANVTVDLRIMEKPASEVTHLEIQSIADGKKSVTHGEWLVQKKTQP